MGGSGLWISARDLARIRQLCLQNRVWHERRVISADWIAALWTPCPVNPS
ncbi:hypothetical protein [Streptomyces sp. S.PB5]|nr:hypothetical protein [Streptomyces sp. S.PB5]MDN3026316.1 hypothetical protein [Streptomyces sp. S.PB5]